jgi:hypothetical protein
MLQWYKYAGGSFGEFGEHSLLRNRKVGYIISANGNDEIKKMNKYAIEIFYSDEDEGYIAVVPELLNYCPLSVQYLYAYTNKSKNYINT